MKEQIINLGNALVTELDLDSGVDTLAKWMAHFIAEQIIKIENTAGDEKYEAERCCFDTILKLWEHRALLPNGCNPFKDFERIFQTLERIDPESERSFYYHIDKNENLIINEDVQKWLDIALDIDQVARVWLRYAFEQAARSATDENTIKWLENSAAIADNKGDVSIIVKLLSQEELGDLLEDGTSSIETVRQKKRKLLSSRIKKLEDFRRSSEELLLLFKQELEDISSDSPLVEEEK